MLLYLIIVASLYIREGSLQECRYAVSQQNAISCASITTDEELNHAMNDTLSPYGDLTWVIEIVEVRDSNMLNLTINKLRFLTQLKQLVIRNSNIRTLLSGNPDETMDYNDLEN
ncbi:hypothetical protein ILUMI_04739 [Ignelater luminosus]|uniref:Uncharacterized protein n=1 Tax=Ignelater luminosus TaxID=2038154 RepID=A0A8K0DE81_IGNLU|nr:hypothetical protein ILUMI_04739 [Ignelater luminosus]